MSTQNISCPQVLQRSALRLGLECRGAGGPAWSEALEVQVPKPPSRLCTKHTPHRAVSRGAPEQTVVTLQPPVLCIQDSWLSGSSPIPRKHQYFMGSSLLASNRVFNCHETIQNFQLRANRLPSAGQPEQAGVIILKASDKAVQHAASQTVCGSGCAPLDSEHPVAPPLPPTSCSKQTSGRHWLQSL